MNNLFKKKNKNITTSKEDIAKIIKISEKKQIIEINVEDFSFLMHMPSNQFEAISFKDPFLTKSMRFLRDEKDTMLNKIKKLKLKEIKKEVLLESNIEESSLYLYTKCYDQSKPFSQKNSQLIASNYEKISTRIQKTFIVQGDIVKVMKSFNFNETALIIHPENEKQIFKVLMPIINLHKDTCFLVMENLKNASAKLKEYGFKPLNYKCSKKDIWFKQVT